MADMEMIRLVSARTGLGMKFVSKDARLSMLLAQIGRLLEGSKGKHVVLKGGTALNRIYIKKRFSEDIDLDLISAAGEAKKLESVKEIMNGVKGFEIEPPRRMGRVYRFDCGYENEFGERDKIRVEFNLSHSKIAASSEPEKSAISSFIMPSEAALITAYSIEDLIARKIAAIMSREDWKDTFDLFYALDMDFDRKMLREALMALGFKDTGELSSSLSKRLELMKGKSSLLGNSANHYMPRELRPDWKAFIDTLIYKAGHLF